MKQLCPLLLILTLAGSMPVVAQSAWVHYDNTHTLVYSNDDLGNHLPDFSFAGYEEGGVAIPTNVPVAETINPVNGDNTANIQDAINAVSALTPDVNGFRGAVLLNPGTYIIGGTLRLNASGVVLRGSGNDPNTGTVLLVTNTARTVLTISGSGSWSVAGNAYTITDPYVPLGATSFHVTSGPITWGANTTIANDADVFTNGTFLYAYNWTGTNAAVNGITFTGATSANPGNVSLSGMGSHYGGYVSSAAPFSDLSAAYRSVLAGGEYNSGPDAATVTLNNLTPGRIYAVQIWASDPRGGGTAGRTETLGSSNTVVLAYNVPPATGGVGQYAIGVFTAAATSQPFSLATTNASGSTQLNALLVSDVTATGYQPVSPPTQSASVSLAAGDTIMVQRPQTQSWIDAIGMNVLSNAWTPGSGLEFERQITAIDGNQISVDAPLCNPIESAWTTGVVYQVTDSGRIQQCGLENLCAVGQIADYPSNILTGVFADFVDLKNCWARNILLSGWGNGITLDNGTKWCTVQDCEYTNPATSSADDAPAAYTIGDSGAQDLFQRCTSDGGYYHIMVTQAGTPGPNVFLNFTSSGTHYNGGPHQHWAAGALHDNIAMAADSEGGYTPYLAINNRGNDGSGQGWGAGFSVMYNCRVPQFQLEQPATTTNQYNWTIGGIGSARSYSDPGLYDALGTMVNPHSLYLEQLRERLGGAAVENIGYTLFTISNSPATESISAGTSAIYTVALGDPALMSNIVMLSVSGLPANISASFNTNTVTGAGNATLTLTTSNSIAPGSYTFDVVGANSGLTHTTQVSLVVGRAADANLKWSSTSNSAWGVMASSNWFNLDTGEADQFYDGDRVLFDDTAGVVTNLSIAAGVTVLPGAMTNDSSVNNFTISGAGGIGGAVQLVKWGGSTLTLATSNTFTGGVLIGDGTLVCGNSNALGFPGGGVIITNAGTLDVDGIDLSTEPVVVSGIGAGGNGAIVNNGPAQTTALRTLTLAGDTTFGGTARWDIRNAGGAASLDLTPAGSGFNLIKAGTNQVSLVGVSPIDPTLGNIDIQQGTLAVQTSTAQLGDPTKTITVYSNATLELWALTASPLNKDIVVNDGGTVFNEKGPSLIIGPMTVNGMATIDVTNYGTPPSLTISNTISGLGGLTIVGGGDLVLAGTDTYSGSTVINAGDLILTNTGSISDSAVIAVNNGGTLDASQRSDQTWTLISGQTLTGNGVVIGNAVISSGATLSPGGALTILTFNDNLTLAGGCTTMMELDKTLETNDVAQVGGMLIYGGTLALTNLSGALADGDNFKLFNAAVFGGAFTNITPAIPAINLAWNANSLTNGILGVVALPTAPPRIGLASFNGTNLVLRGLNGVPDWPCLLLGSTNLALPMNQWRVVATNNFDNGGGISFTNTWPAGGSDQVFYRLQMN